MRNELNVLERELATKLIDRAPSCDKIIADGKRMFSALCLRYSHFISCDHAEDAHASVAAASVVAKALRDERFNLIRARYEPEFGPIAGGGYGNAATRKWLRAYVERYRRLPDEARRVVAVSIRSRSDRRHATGATAGRAICLDSPRSPCRS